jgi:hypothetical protein
MKYLIGCAVFLLLLSVLLLGGPQRAGRAMDTRGDKQFSFSDDEVSVYGGLEPREDIKKDNLGMPLSGPSGTPPGQTEAYNQSSASGRSDSGKHSHLKTGMGDSVDIQPLQDSQSALRSGQSAGQLSNVPGTTSTSPNGDANGYGTGGLPLFSPDDNMSKNKTDASGG